MTNRLLRPERRIDRHIAALASADAGAAARAERALIRYYGSRALEQLVAACSHHNPMVRLRAAWALGHTHDSRAYEPLLSLIGDPDEQVRYDATIALGILGDDRAREQLVRIYLHDDASRPVGMALCKMGPRAVTALAEVLKRGTASVRRSIVQDLGNLAADYASEEAIELLLLCIRDADPLVREEAASWLSEIQAS